MVPLSAQYLGSDVWHDSLMGATCPSHALWLDVALLVLHPIAVPLKGALLYPQPSTMALTGGTETH